MNSTIAKIFGWVQFGLMASAQVFSTTPHGWQGWITALASLGVAIATHAAASTDGSK